MNIHQHKLFFLVYWQARIDEEIAKEKEPEGLSKEDTDYLVKEALKQKELSALKASQPTVEIDLDDIVEFFKLLFLCFLYNNEKCWGSKKSSENVFIKELHKSPL
ncbi:MAG: hypothetical protein HEEMFOPI_00268 [Holosporales bacterium]